MTTGIYPRTIEHNKAISKALKGKRHVKLMGKPQSNELIIKRANAISIWWKNNKNSEQVMLRNKKISSSLTGKPMTEASKKTMSDTSKRKWQDINYRKKQIEKILAGLIKRPSSYEQKISDLCIKHNLHFVYTGDGTFLIGYKNPDFVDEKNKIVIEVYNDYFKIRDFGSCESYEKQRAEHFEKYGYKTIFIVKADIKVKNWEEICLNKISGRSKS